MTILLVEDFQCQSARVTRGCALREATHGNLLGHEPDHRASPPLKLLAESRTLGVSRAVYRVGSTPLLDGVCRNRFC
jgi:hypothetical protein